MQPFSHGTYHYRYSWFCHWNTVQSFSCDSETFEFTVSHVTWLQWFWTLRGIRLCLSPKSLPFPSFLSDKSVPYLGREWNWAPLLLTCPVTMWSSVGFGRGVALQHRTRVSSSIPKVCSCSQTDFWHLGLDHGFSPASMKLMNTS